MKLRQKTYPRPTSFELIRAKKYVAYKKKKAAAHTSVSTVVTYNFHE